MSFNRYVSGLLEIEDAWLRAPVVSGPFLPLGSGTIGSSESPFQHAYLTEITNKQGPLRVNDVSSAAPIDLINEGGVVKPQLRHDDSLAISDGKLG
ncbi:hypothetical protein HK097_005367, partial [Rhizophlyctis rosea]